MAVTSESVDTVNYLRAQAGLPPIQATLDGSATTQLITQNSIQQPPANITYVPAQNNFVNFSSPTPQVVSLSSTNSAASTSQNSAAGASTSSTSASPAPTPLAEFLGGLGLSRAVHLTALQKRLLALGGASLAGGAAVAAGSSLLGAKRHSRRRYTARSSYRRSVRRHSRKAAHLVRGSAAARRHMARLRKMRKH